MIDIPAGIRLVLASASPRRSELLRSVGLEFDVLPADIDESARPGELPADYVERLSGEKAAVVAGRIGEDVIVVAADTTVDVDGQILEKPLDDADARRMLALLSGRPHLVHTAVTVLRSTGRSDSVVVTTAVEFVALTPADRRVVRGNRGAVRQGRRVCDPGRRWCARAATRRQRHQCDRSSPRRNPRPRPKDRGIRSLSVRIPRSFGGGPVSTLGCRLLTEGGRA